MSDVREKSNLLTRNQSLLTSLVFELLHVHALCVIFVTNLNIFLIDKNYRENLNPSKSVYLPIFAQ